MDIQSSLQASGLSQVSLGTPTDNFSSSKQKVDAQDIKLALNTESAKTEVSQEKNLSPAQMNEQVSRLNSNLEQSNSYLRFERDKESDKMIFFIKDIKTDEVVRQIPSKEFLTVSRSISDYLETVNSTAGKREFPVGLLTNTTA